MRRASKVDATHQAIVERLRSIGVWVLSLAATGKGCPDLLCWSRGRFFLLELKSGNERPNQMQAEFMASCPGEIHIARTPDEAVLAAVGAEAMK
jgi:Holliday junction resolvase